jgi:hypothetical protein
MHLNSKRVKIRLKFRSVFSAREIRFFNLSTAIKNIYAENELKRVSIDLFGFNFLRDG